MALRVLILLASLATGAIAAAAAEFRTFDGHGGPVKGVAVSADGRQLLTASFDYSVGLWSMGAATPPAWLEGHDAAVNAVSFVPGGRAVSAGDDFAVILWELDTGRMLHRMEGHTAKAVAARPSPDGGMIASAGWDGTIRLWDVETGAALAVLRGHDGPVNDVIWADGGAHLYSAGRDGSVILWDVATRAVLRRVAAHGFGVNVLALDETAGWLAYGALDGVTRVIDLADGRVLADLTAGRRPILGLALSPDGRRLAISDGQGYIMVVSTSDWSVERDFHAARNGPVWALAFTADSAGIVAGGMASSAYLWPLEGDLPDALMAAMQPGRDTAEMSNGARQFFRKCAICHTLEPDGKRRAGPSLFGVMGRRAGSLPGYTYSAALRESGLVWSGRTIDRLFEVGPAHLTPGSKMPMQRIGSARDRADLIAFLKRQTAPE